mmetsp:Transcript_32397/g.70019  ORF Transcript_32397/g.70019 Transcript_32397/m.70019 type:complete len:116 (-) Transcript_32397:1010-1357(-)
MTSPTTSGQRMATVSERIHRSFFQIQGRRSALSQTKQGLPVRMQWKHSNSLSSHVAQIPKPGRRALGAAARFDGVGGGGRVTTCLDTGCSDTAGTTCWIGSPSKGFGVELARIAR